MLPRGVVLTVSGVATSFTTFSDAGMGRRDALRGQRPGAPRDAAAAARARLRAACPGVRISVRIDRATSRLQRRLVAAVTWTDGPSPEQVLEIIDPGGRRRARWRVERHYSAEAAIVVALSELGTTAALAADYRALSDVLTAASFPREDTPGLPVEVLGRLARSMTRHGDPLRSYEAAALATSTLRLWSGRSAEALEVYLTLLADAGGASGIDYGLLEVATEITDGGGRGPAASAPARRGAR